ncbi:hypothetical protein Anas_05146 [Armadillidium nasatum]|uniref:Uncharacterized protein n=1 Tax=Armadillidium nasatum TaxID=96803 RepID=A0A5N5SQN5_9CRUS|nr:hypothetical protein Anas_05146 [Armadillidium nasatum]
MAYETGIPYRSTELSQPKPFLLYSNETDKSGYESHLNHKKLKPLALLTPIKDLSQKISPSVEPHPTLVDRDEQDINFGGGNITGRNEEGLPLLPPIDPFDYSYDDKDIVANQFYNKAPKITTPTFKTSVLGPFLENTTTEPLDESYRTNTSKRPSTVSDVQDLNGNLESSSKDPTLLNDTSVNRKFDNNNLHTEVNQNIENIPQTNRTYYSRVVTNPPYTHQVYLRPEPISPDKIHELLLQQRNKTSDENNKDGSSTSNNQSNELYKQKLIFDFLNSISSKFENNNKPLEEDSESENRSFKPSLIDSISNNDTNKSKPIQPLIDKIGDDLNNTENLAKNLPAKLNTLLKLYVVKLIQDHNSTEFMNIIGNADNFTSINPKVNLSNNEYSLLRDSLESVNEGLVNLDEVLESLYANVTSDLNNRNQTENNTKMDMEFSELKEDLNQMYLQKLLNTIKNSSSDYNNSLNSSCENEKENNCLNDFLNKLKNQKINSGTFIKFKPIV